MAKDTFIDNLRRASKLLAPPRVLTEKAPEGDPELAFALESADLWLTPKVVEGFDPADFPDLPKDQRGQLVAEVDAFLKIARTVPGNKPAKKSESRDARRHLEKIIGIVRNHLLPHWLDAQKTMIADARKGAKEKGWYVEEDEKRISESLLGTYMAPRLRIRSPDSEVVLDPVACFGSGRKGIVDLMVLPTYERAFLVTFKDGRWAIVSLTTQREKPFTPASFVNTVTSLAPG